MAIPKSDRAAVRQIIRRLKSVGAEIYRLDNGAEDINAEGWGEKKLLDNMFQTWSDIVYWVRGEDRLWIWFVYGNSPEEVAADWEHFYWTFVKEFDFLN